jgi:hypothetical protein
MYEAATCAGGCLHRRDVQGRIVRPGPRTSDRVLPRKPPPPRSPAISIHNPTSVDGMRLE